MEISNKVLKNIMKIKKITGFHIIVKGDPSVGVANSEWKLEGEFYFDDEEELQLFKKNLKLAFEEYCGEISIDTFEEYQKKINSEENENK